MATRRLRTLLLGDDADFLWTSVLIGIVAVFPAGLLLRLLDGAFLVPGALMAIVTVAVLLVAFPVVYLNGGLLPVWIALFPSVFIAALREGGSGLVQPSTGELLVGALLTTIVVGTVAHVVIRGVIHLRTVFRRLIDSTTSTGDGTESFGDGGRGEGHSDQDFVDSRLGRTDADQPLTRRSVLLAGGGGLLGALGIGFGHAYGWWCRTSPVDCLVENSSGRQVDLEVTVTRRGFEVFHAEPELGQIEQRHQSGVGRPMREHYESAIPIGCSLPEDVVVRVESDVVGSVRETVTFPNPDPPSGGGFTSATLAIEVTSDGIDVEAVYRYWIE